MYIGLDKCYCTFNRLLYALENQTSSYDLFYSDIYFIVVVWNQTRNVSRVCLHYSSWRIVPHALVRLIIAFSSESLGWKLNQPAKHHFPLMTTLGGGQQLREKQ